MFLITKGQDPEGRRTPVDTGLDLRISTQAGPVFIPGVGHKIPAEMVSGLRQMLTPLAASGQWPQVVAITAALREEGVSRTALALSAVLNHDTGEPVCLVDTNWYWPAMPGLDSPGLAGVLAGTTRLEEALVRVDHGNLMVLPSGELPENRRASAARSARLKATIDELCQHFKYLILDVPSIQATSDAVALAGLADACCLVLRQGVTPGTTVREARDAIGHLRVMGVIMNRVRVYMPVGLADQLIQP